VPAVHQPEFPSLDGGRLLVLSHVLDRDAPGLQVVPERARRQDRADPVAQHVQFEALDIEVHVLGIADAAVEEPEVAAAFDHERPLVGAASEECEEEQVKLLDDLGCEDWLHGKTPAL